MKLNNLVVTLIAVWVSGSAAFAPLNAPKSHLPTTKVQLPEHSLLAQKGDEQAATSFSSTRTTNNSNALAPIAAATALGVLFTAEPAQAADLFPIKSALAAYVHYLSLLVGVACLVTERLTVKADMTEEEENRLIIADSIWGLSGLTLVASGYFRVVEFGKGWEFYSHEPIFWLKMTLLGVVGAASFFPTTTIIKRAVEKKNNGSIAPMSPELANRMTSVINAEILAFLSIPFAATLMSRGVLYNDDFQWQTSAAAAFLLSSGLGFKYVREALGWEEQAPAATEE